MWKPCSIDFHLLFGLSTKSPQILRGPCRGWSPVSYAWLLRRCPCPDSRWTEVEAVPRRKRKFFTNFMGEEQTSWPNMKGQTLYNNLSSSWNKINNSITVFVLPYILDPLGCKNLKIFIGVIILIFHLIHTSKGGLTHTHTHFTQFSSLCHLGCPKWMSWMDQRGLHVLRSLSSFMLLLGEGAQWRTHSFVYGKGVEKGFRSGSRLVRGWVPQFHIEFLVAVKFTEFESSSGITSTSLTVITSLT